MVKRARLPILLLGASLLAAVALAADPPASVDLSRYKDRLAAAVFSHKVHLDAKIECLACHHTAKDGKPVQRCDACHKRQAEGKAAGFKDAFHRTCKGCHEKASKPSAPTKCSGCHHA